MNFSQIYEGWKNKLIPEKEMVNIIQSTSEQRMAVCNACEFHSDNRIGYKSLRPDAHCTDCGCTLSAKVACLSCGCPLDKWKALVTAEQEKEIDGE